MFSIEEKFGSAACYATNIEDKRVKQIRAMLHLSLLPLVFHIAFPE